MIKPLKILLLEDNPADAEMIRRFLTKEHLNCEFHLAQNEEAYRDALNQFQPDVILSDHSLPQFNSSDALLLARGRFDDIPFIMVTGAVSEEFAADIIKLGADDYLLKDRLSRLPAAIDIAIKKRKAEKEKEETEKKIVQSEANLRTIFENTSEGFLLLDQDATVIAFNSKALTYSFLSKEKKIETGKSVYDFIPLSRRKIFDIIISKALKGETIQYDSPFDVDNDRIAWIDFSVTPVIEDGQVQGVCVTGRDITERKKGEEELKKNYLEKRSLAERMSTILNALPAYVALLNEDGLIIDVNRAWQNFGDPKGFIGDNYAVGDNYVALALHAKGVGKDDGRLVGKGILSVLKKMTPGFTYDYAYKSGSGKVWYKMIVTPLQEKEKAGVVVMHINITEQKRSDEALQITLKELSDYKIALDESTIVSITNKKGIIIYVNDNFCKISGYSASDLLGKDHMIINSGLHDKGFMKSLWTTISNGKIWRNEIKNKSKHGDFYWVDTTIVPFLNDKGKPVQYVAINKDITEKKLMEEKMLEQKVQEQKKITRAVIKAQERERNRIGQELHDNVNQILASTKLYLSVASKSDAKVKKLISYPMEMIDNSISEIRLLSSRQVTPLKNINLEELIQSLVDSLLKKAGIKTDFTCNIISKSIDDDFKLNIYRIVQEELNNIIKHAGAKNVSISINSMLEGIDILVTDDGKGFDVAKKRKGIGISNIIYRIESFNGKIIITSSPGKGCKTEISLPY
ncbi:MAG: PAS domain S-box protein [Ginsengibacter sp.]